MSDEKKKALEAQIRAFVGKPVGPVVVGRDPVNEPMIRQWCDAMGETHPAYLDADAAKKTVHGEIVAPPTMLQAWVMEGWAMHEGYDEPKNEQHRLHKVLADNGYTGVLGTNTEENYTRYLRLGETVKALTVIDSISEEKATGVGIGYFITTKTTFENQDGEDLGSMSFRVLRFKPANAQAAASKEGESKATADSTTRIKPPMGHDNAWWWEKVASDGVIPIQRCTSCQKLRHPPRPMCDACGSQGFDAIAASGRATVHTFTVIHYPQFPGYEYPIVSIIVDLEEGERMASTLVDCKPEDVSIGMAVEAVIHEDEDGFKIPFFRPAAR
ncbi:MAG: bifunctional MaoC family dehydratase/OB-fold nucleic acid binding domain-containing protein [Myxococcales bacterium]|nr:bifunctional MaoC family dehydratase/OB-fold nucleic acid binding domain-containing protein [Myxococcales bacterium]